MMAAWLILLAAGAPVPDEPTCADPSTPDLDPTHKYLLYNVNYGERFNFRKSILRRVVNTVKVLNDTTDYTWVLVLSPFRENYKGDVDFLPWGDVFKVSAFRAYPNVIEYHTYVKAFGNKIDVFMRPTSWEATQEMKKASQSCADYITSEDFSTVGIKLNHEGGRITLPGKFVVMGQELEIGRFECIQQWGCRTRELRDLLRDSAADGQSIMVDHYEAIYPPQDNVQHPYWGVRQYIRPVELLEREALRYLRTWFVEGEEPTDDPPRFLSMHMRRGDFTFAHAKTQSTEEEIVATIAAKAAEYDLNTLFLASDASLKEIASLEGRLKKVNGGIKVRVYKPMSPAGVGNALFDYRSGAGLGKYALVEQVHLL
jgi:hypothetical protein